MDQLLTHSVIMLGAATAAIWGLRFFAISPIVGYLLAGLVIGPFGLGLVGESEGLAFMGELGIVFLMFVVGLEFSLPAILDARRAVFLGGGLQVLVTTILFYGGLVLLGVPPLGAFLGAAALAMSSTALVLKSLAENGQLRTAFGRDTVGILLFQDIATIPLLVLIAALAQSGGAEAGDLAMALARAAGLFLVLYLIGRFVLSGLVSHVIALNCIELRLLLILLIIMAAAWLAHAAGASLPLGAFLAGMIIGETKFKHDIETDIRPFRDILLGIFFITVGMQFDFAVIPDRIGVILLALLGLLAIKVLLITALLRLIGKPRQEALQTAITLGQGGEFGLLIMSLANKGNIIPASLAEAVIIAIIISMLMAPFIIRNSENLGTRIDRLLK